MKTLLIVIGIVILSAAFIWWEVRRASIGYEDKDGFHKGESEP